MDAQIHLIEDDTVTDLRERDVILRRSWFTNSRMAERIEERVFTVHGGQPKPVHQGNRVYGHFVVDGKEDSVSLRDIERFAKPEEIELALIFRNVRASRA
jgi:hypothetical protein